MTSLIVFAKNKMFIYNTNLITKEIVRRAFTPHDMIFLNVNILLCNCCCFLSKKHPEGIVELVLKINKYFTNSTKCNIYVFCFFLVI